MRVSTFIWAALTVAAGAVLCAGSAAALCSINSTGMSVSPGTASAGTYTPPTAPTSLAVSITISGTYFSLLAGNCTLALSFQRSSYPPATMGNTGGGSATLPYTITSAFGGGGTTLLFSSGSPGSNVLQYSFPAAILGLNAPFTATLTVHVLMQPNSPQAAGAYSDSLVASVYDVNNNALRFTRGFTVTGTVSKACLINNVANPGADSATIPINAVGAVTTTAINRSYSNVVCNTPSTLLLTSQSGGVVTNATPPSGFTNIINYSASVTFSGATATLDTSTNPSATGAESGMGVSTAGTPPSGTLAVTITPQANLQQLIAGSYADTLTITIVPQ